MGFVIFLPIFLIKSDPGYSGVPGVCSGHVPGFTDTRVWVQFLVDWKVYLGYSLSLIFTFTSAKAFKFWFGL